MKLAEQLQLFSACLYEPADVVELRFLDPAGDERKARSDWATAENLRYWDADLARRNKTLNCYAGANPRKAIGQRKAEGVDLARCIFVEWDGVTIDVAAANIDAAGLPLPTCVVWSGGGVHVYWRLSSPLLDMALWTTCQKQMIKLLDADKCIHDPPRIMRLPGLLNHKEGRTVSWLVYAEPSHRVSAADLIERCPKVEVPPEQYMPRTVKCSSNYGRSALLQECDRVSRSVNGHRHMTLFRSACAIGNLVGSGLIGRDDAVAALQHAGQSTGLPVPEVLDTVAKGLARGATTPRLQRRAS